MLPTHWVCHALCFVFLISDLKKNLLLAFQFKTCIFGITPQHVAWTFFNLLKHDVFYHCIPGKEILHLRAVQFKLHRGIATTLEPTEARLHSSLHLRPILYTENTMLWQRVSDALRQQLYLCVIVCSSDGQNIQRDITSTNHVAIVVFVDNQQSPSLI